MGCGSSRSSLTGVQGGDGESEFAHPIALFPGARASKALGELDGAVATSGALPENVNYAVKSSFLLGFLESVPELSAKLKEPKLTATPKFEDVVHAAEQAAVLVLVY